MRSLDTCTTGWNVIAACYQSRHVTGFRNLGDTGGPAPMDVGALKGKGKQEAENCLSLFESLKGKYT